MDPTLKVVLLTTLAGAAMPAGGLLASFERIHPRWLEQEFRHAVIAFGAGALIAAVGLVLAPEGAARLPVGWAAAALLSGGVAFLGLDKLLARSTGSEAQLVAMLSDFVPEALAMGATFAQTGTGGGLLALLIALQNLPEGFNAYREIVSAARMRPLKVLGLFTALALLGPAAGLLGLFVLSSHDAVVGFVMLFASGGILYLTFQDLAPKAKLARTWAPPLGAVLGFMLGLIGQMVIGE